MKNLQDGSLVRLVQVTDVTSSNEAQTQTLKSETDKRISALEEEWEAGFVKLKEQVEALEYWKDYDQPDLDDYCTKDEVPEHQTETMDVTEIKSIIDARIEGQVTSVTECLTAVILEHCPAVADKLGQAYMLEREHIIESNTPKSHTINFPSNQKLAEIAE